MVDMGSYFSSWYLSDKLLVDDVLDVTSLQGTPGLIGSIFGLGLFASACVNPGMGVSGLIYRDECTHGMFGKNGTSTTLVTAGNSTAIPATPDVYRASATCNGDTFI